MIFQELLRKKEIEKITVREISKRAEINPSTFYAHYQDVYDLMEQIEKKTSEQFAQTLWDEGKQDYSLKFEKLFTMMQKNKEFYKIYLNQMGKSIVLSQKIREDALATYGKKERREMEYHLVFFSAGVHAVIQKWLNDDCKETPKEIASFVEREYEMH
ncbi:MAG: TetR/AcrR family transcriptional regulator [Suipraeoptans sp.]